MTAEEFDQELRARYGPPPRMPSRNIVTVVEYLRKTYLLDAVDWTLKPEGYVVTVRMGDRTSAPLGGRDMDHLVADAALSIYSKEDASKYLESCVERGRKVLAAEAEVKEACGLRRKTIQHLPQEVESRGGKPETVAFLKGIYDEDENFEWIADEEYVRKAMERGWNGRGTDPVPNDIGREPGVRGEPGIVGPALKPPKGGLFARISSFFSASS